jgi:small GTP-binding protein
VKDKCAIVLTPPGKAAIAVVRLVGETAEFLARHFSRPVPPGRPVHGNLTDGDRIIDDPVAVVHAGGVDLSLHGGPWVVRQVLELASRNGFEIVHPLQPPLPLEAVDGDDEIEREMLAHLPLARTEMALRLLLAQRAAWRRLSSQSSPGAPGLSPQSYPDPSLWWLLHPPRVAIVGAPNVGKSTLANQLFAQERSITADQPGTTRDWVEEIADVDGLAVRLTDTPGLRESADPIEQAAITASGGQIQSADLIVLVVDATQPLEEQRRWTGRYPQALVVRNKCDQAVDMRAIDVAKPHIHTIATNGDGVDHLRQTIRRRFMRSWRHARALNFKSF